MSPLAEVDSACTCPVGHYHVGV